MSNGYRGKILVVDLSSGKINEGPLEEGLYRDFNYLEGLVGKREILGGWGKLGRMISSPSKGE